MKKSIVFILCLMLAFAGCANGNSTQPETVPPHMYTLEYFSSLVEGESDLKDINDIIATDSKMDMLATSYGGLLEFPLEDGGCIQIRMYMQNGEMIVGKITTDTAQAEAVPTNPYSLTNAVGNPFGELDAAYDRAHTAAETTEQLYAVEDTYLAYWKAEVQKEFVLLKSVLDAETASRLDTAQAAWEAQVNESIQLEYDIPEYLVAPIKEGDTLGSIIYRIDGEQFGVSIIYAKEGVEKISIMTLIERIIKRIVCG